MCVLVRSSKKASSLPILTRKADSDGPYSRSENSDTWNMLALFVVSQKMTLFFVLFNRLDFLLWMDALVNLVVI